MVVIVVIQSVIVGDQVLQQLRLNGNTIRNCNSIGDQSASVVRVESGSTSTTISTVAHKSTINGHFRRRLSATEKCHVMLITNKRQKLSTREVRIRYFIE